MTTVAAILAALASIGSIATALAYVIKLMDEKFTKSQAERDAQIDRDIARGRQEAEESGRPQ